MQSFPAIDAIRNPVFRRLWVVTMISGLSVGSTLTALGWVIVEESGDPFLVSLVLVTFLFPQMFAGPIGGVMADRYGRPRVIRLGISARASLSIVMAASLFVFPHEIAPLLVINTVRSIAAGSTVPSRRAFMADIVPPRQLTTALALDEFAVTALFIAGPIVTGALLLLINPGWIFIGLACVSVVGVAIVPSAAGAPAKAGREESVQAGRARTSFFRDLFDGLNYIRRSRMLLAVTGISLAAEMLAFNFMTLVPVFSKEVFDGGAGLLGMLNGTMPVGELLGAGTMAILAAKVIKPARLLVISVFIAFSIGIPLGASTWLPVTMLLLVGLGAVAQVFIVMTVALLLRETPPEARARILGLQQVTWGFGALGGLMSGILASAFSPHVGVIVPSILGIVILILIVVISSELRRDGRKVEDDDVPAPGLEEAFEES
jgi:MFS family permease|tara:strand:+ start:334 stop:1632 length:1299 start_codon:yes stop_codon:yes gene_type:complete